MCRVGELDTEVTPILSDNALVLACDYLEKKLYKLTLKNEKLASLVLPGQFMHIQLGEESRHILRRPISVQETYANAKGEHCISLVYQVVGAGTQRLGSAGGSRMVINVLGPIGSGWQPPVDAKRALLVGGGVGWAPLAMLAGNLCNSGVEVHALIGAQNADIIKVISGATGCLALNSPSCDVINSNYVEHIATDDGSIGHHGFNTELIPDLLNEYEFDYIATCGPEPMQKIVARLAAEAGIPCEVSLERRMACGVGACLSCVVDTTDGKKRTCVDGPVFDASVVVW